MAEKKIKSYLEDEGRETVNRGGMRGLRGKIRRNIGTKVGQEKKMEMVKKERRGKGCTK